MGFAVITIVCLGLYFHSCESNDEVDYQFQRISKGEVVRTVFVTGKVDFLAVDFVKSDVPSGIISAVNAGLNSVVRKYDILATISAEDVAFNTKQAKENLIQANLALDSAKDLLEQKHKLLDNQVISLKEFEEAKRNYERALSNQRTCQNTTDKMNKDLAACVVRAPVAGQISQVWAFPQMAVGKGTDLFQIVENIKKMSLSLNIDETDIGSVQEGRTVEFSVSAYPDKKFSGKITSISTTPTTQSNVVTYTAWAECDNSSMLLKSGMSATASIFVDKADAVLRIPNEAFTASPVFSNAIPGKRFAWKKDHSADPMGMKKIEIKTGLSGNGFTQILSGDIKEGDQVLVQIRKRTKGQSIPGL
jgi:HlyD family secretion protein